MSFARRPLAAAALLALGAAAASCLFGIDPDAPRFRCQEERDCGAGFECRPQAAGGGLCYRQGECAAAEACNELDDNCDGQVDEGFDLLSDPANCGGCGAACNAGSACAVGRCLESSCHDALDNDQDGLADCADDDCPLGGPCAEDAGLNCGQRVADAGAPDAGADAGEPDAGTLERACVLREADCANGADDDLDGRADCEDVDCEGLTCGGGQKVCTAGVCQ